jgi:aldehyde:ferredoxin oxidoreductase
MYYGWTGNFLRVDLSQKKVIQEKLDSEVARNYLGGRGLGIYFLSTELDPACNPLSPENMLILATGPLTGTQAPTAARAMVTTKSPLT